MEREHRFINNMENSNVARDNTTCGACHFSGKTADAVAFCFECGQSLCKECLVYHTRFPATRKHRTEMFSDKVERQEPQSTSLLLRCDYHESKEVRYYCFNHKEVYCGLCRAVKHSSCHEKPISEICDVMELKELELALATLDQLTGTLNKARLKRQKEIDEMVRIRTVCIDEINILKQRLLRLFEQLDRNVAQNITEVDQRLEEFRTASVLYNDALEHIAYVVDQIKTAFQTGDKASIFVAQTKAQKLKTDYTCLVDNRKSNFSPLKLSFKQDAQIVDILSTCESLGEVNLEIIEAKVPVQEQSRAVVPVDMLQLYQKNAADKLPHITRRIAAPMKGTEAGLATTHTMMTGLQPLDIAKDKTDKSLDVGHHSTNVKSHSVAVESNLPKTLLYSAVVESGVGLTASSSSTEVLKTVNSDTKNFLGIKLKSKRNCSISKDSDKGSCDITGSAFLPNGALVICNHFHKTMVVLDRSFSVTHSKRLGDHPWDVAAYGDDEFVVTLTKSRVVKFVKVGENGLVFSGSFQTKKDCWGIEAYEELLIITFHDNPGNGVVEIRTRKGQTLQQIKTDSEEKILFMSPCYVALDPRKEHIYVTDGKNNSVTCLTIQGKFVATAKSDNLKWPKGLLIDGNSNILVSAHFGDQLKILQQKGRRGSTKYCDASLPQTLAFRWDDMTMIIGTNGGHNISVYTFERV